MWGCGYGYDRWVWCGKWVWVCGYGYDGCGVVGGCVGVGGCLNPSVCTLVIEFLNKQRFLML